MTTRGRKGRQTGRGGRQPGREGGRKRREGNERRGKNEIMHVNDKDIRSWGGGFIHFLYQNEKR